MSQSHLSWAERAKFGKGEVSEHQFELWAQRNDVVAITYGFRNEDMPKDAQGKELVTRHRFTRLSPHIRMTPDFACMSKKAGFLVEVKGCGSRGLKIKDETMESLEWWTTHDPVYFFVYNSSSHKCAMISFEDMQNLCNDVPTDYFESDKKPYSLIKIKSITNWEDIPEEDGETL